MKNEELRILFLRTGEELLNDSVIPGKFNYFLNAGNTLDKKFTQILSQGKESTKKIYNDNEAKYSKVKDKKDGFLIFAIKAIFSLIKKILWIVFSIIFYGFLIYLIYRYFSK